MEYVLLIVVVVLVSLQNVLKKQYNTKTSRPCSFLFSLFATLAALIFFLIRSGFQLDFQLSVVPYSLFFAITFAGAMAGSFLAIQTGPLSLTMLITSYSLIIPTFYGVFFLQDPLNGFGIFGLCCLFVSLFLIRQKSSGGKIGFRWIVCLLIAFFGNGLCSLVQKLQQMKFSGGYKNEFMILALLFCAVFLFAVAMVRKESFAGQGKIIFPFSVACGLANGVVNYLVMVLTGMIPNAILFPSISAGGILLGFVAAVFVYREKLTKTQLAGYFIGVLATLFLNL